MNREILFRGKRKDNGEWVYWDVFGDLMEFVCFQNEEYKSLHYDASKKIIDTNTLGQYIGKRDNNSKKIFEGDIIRQLYSQYQRFDVVGAVRFNKAGQFVADHVWTAEQNPWKKGKKQGFAITSQCEKLGNIYDNPELLEAQP